MRRFAPLFALLLPALSFGAALRVVPEVVMPLCGSCGLAGAAGSRLNLTANSALVPTLAPMPALVANLPAALGAPEAAKELIVPGRAQNAAPKLIVAQSADIASALAAAEAADHARNEGAPAPDAAQLLNFDGSRPKGADDEAFIPQSPGPTAVLAEGLPVLRRLEAATERVRAEVDVALPALQRSVERGGWNGPHTTLDGPCCGDAAPKLAAFLRLRGLPAMLVESEFHYYVVVRMPDGDIVVDPTFRQFFGREKAPAGVPRAFVGTWGALESFFSAHARSKTTGYGPARLYRSEARSREDLARAAAAAYVAPALAAEHDGLRAALRAPSTERRPPSLLIP